MRATLTGLVSVDAWRKVLQELDAEVRRSSHKRLVVDLRGLLGWLGTPERRAVGAMWATQLSHMEKVALVIQAQKITGVVEEEAQRLGLNLRLFSNEQEAVAWVVA